jgi:hypothetical protein
MPGKEGRNQGRKKESTKERTSRAPFLRKERKKEGATYMYLHLTPVGQARRRFIIKMATEIRRRQERLTWQGREGKGREEGKIAWEELLQCNARPTESRKGGPHGCCRKG